MASKGLQTGIQIALWVVIFGLGYALYYSITKPYEAIERAAELTEMTRERMDNLRTVLINYENRAEFA